METKKSPKIRLIVLISILLCIVLVAGILYFCTPRFGGDTTLCGQDLSGKSLSSAQKLLSGLVEEYRLNLTLEGKDYTFSAGDLGLTFSADAFASVKEGGQIDSWDVLSWDEAKVDAFLDSNFDRRGVTTVLPTVLWNSQKNTFEYTPGEAETLYRTHVYSYACRVTITLVSILKNECLSSCSE